MVSGAPTLSESSIRTFDGFVGGTLEISLEVKNYLVLYNFTLKRSNDGTQFTDLTLSARHSVKYIASVGVHGFVIVTISDLVEEDFTLYTLTTNEAQGPLVYPFYLGESPEDNIVLFTHYYVNPVYWAGTDKH